MAIIITDEDARRNLSMAECIEAMQVAFRDYADGKAKTLPRARYQVDTPDPNRKYLCNVHVGAVPSYGMACVRAGSLCMLVDGSSPDRKIKQNPEPVNWTVIILYDLTTAEPLAFLHESHLSGIRVGATSGAGIDAVARVLPVDHVPRHPAVQRGVSRDHLDSKVLARGGLNGGPLHRNQIRSVIFRWFRNHTLHSAR